MCRFILYELVQVLLVLVGLGKLVEFNLKLELLLLSLQSLHALGMFLVHLFPLECFNDTSMPLYLISVQKRKVIHFFKVLFLVILAQSRLFFELHILITLDKIVIPLLLLRLNQALHPPMINGTLQVLILFLNNAVNFLFDFSIILLLNLLTQILQMIILAFSQKLKLLGMPLSHASANENTVSGLLIAVLRHSLIQLDRPLGLPSQLQLPQQLEGQATRLVGLLVVFAAGGTSLEEGVGLAGGLLAGFGDLAEDLGGLLGAG